MSDRFHVISELHVGTLRDERNYVSLCMDGDTGTWRLFIETTTDPPTFRTTGPYTVMETSHGGQAEFSLDGLREFHRRLGKVLTDIDRDPDEYNAEIRASWDK